MSQRRSNLYAMRTHPRDANFSSRVSEASPGGAYAVASDTSAAPAGRTETITCVGGLPELEAHPGISDAGAEPLRRATTRDALRPAIGEEGRKPKRRTFAVVGAKPIIGTTSKLSGSGEADGVRDAEGVGDWDFVPDTEAEGVTDCDDVSDDVGDCDAVFDTDAEEVRVCDDVSDCVGDSVRAWDIVFDAEGEGVWDCDDVGEYDGSTADGDGESEAENDTRCEPDIDRVELPELERDCVCELLEVCP